MTPTRVLAALALLAAPVLATPHAAQAAHAGAPYKNVNKKNDAGNDTGDAKVDELNAAQLNQNYKGQNPSDMSGGGMAPMGSTAPTSPMMPKSK